MSALRVVVEKAVCEWSCMSALLSSGVKDGSVWVYPLRAHTRVVVWEGSVWMSTWWVHSEVVVWEGSVHLSSWWVHSWVVVWDGSVRLSSRWVHSKVVMCKGSVWVSPWWVHFRVSTVWFDCLLSRINLCKIPHPSVSRVCPPCSPDVRSGVCVLTFASRLVWYVS